MHIGAQGHGVLHATFHFLPQDLRSLFGFGLPALPDTPAWILPEEYAGFSPAQKLEQLRGRLRELGCTAQFVGKLDNLAWLLNLRAMDIECTPYAMAYCYVTPSRAVLFINTARVTPEAKAELEANGITLAEYDDVLKFLAAETEPQTVLAECSTVNYAVYQVLEQNAALTVKDGTDPLLLMKGVKNETELAHTKQGTPLTISSTSWKLAPAVEKPVLVLM